MTILVTGVTGLVGARLLPRLVERGEECRALVRPGKNGPTGVMAVEGDLRCCIAGGCGYWCLGDHSSGRGISHPGHRSDLEKQSGRYAQAEVAQRGVDRDVDFPSLGQAAAGCRSSGERRSGCPIAASAERGGLLFNWLFLYSGHPVHRVQCPFFAGMTRWGARLAGGSGGS